MNLAVDIGNTRIKIGVFANDNLVFKTETAESDFENALNAILKQHELTTAIVAASGNSQKVVTLLQKSGLLVKILDHKTVLPFKNLYKTPQTLGLDRVALVSAAVKSYPEEDVLVIDAGTCVTYDFKNKREEYLGGSISPGLQMRFKALNTFTAGLPLIESGDDVVRIGADTKEAIQSGVIWGITAEINGVIDWYKNKYNDLTIILTGGDMLFLSKTLKNGIFANSNFLLEGLNYLILFNKNQ
ncbi:type III pantothenate kinase [Leeuwenhoekiella sp. A16]|uniref:type III pantothenate kinase n=1 Tax=unclassified Leeuwenhoekiella TaxID=2615029 RepID=UPI003A8107FA